jgi:hypothetical protein
MREKAPSNHHLLRLNEHTTRLKQDRHLCHFPGRIQWGSMGPDFVSVCVWVSRALVVFISCHVALAALPGLRLALGVSDRAMACAAAIVAPLFG